jgi:Tfp pilus assembly protein PilE
VDLSNPIPNADAGALYADDEPELSPAQARGRRRRRLAGLLMAAAAIGTAATWVHRERLPRAEAIEALVDTSRQVESYFEHCAAYPHDLATLRGWSLEGRCDIATSDAGDPLVADERYALRLQSPRTADAGRDSYLLTAEPVGTQVSDGCGSFTFDEQGRRANPGASLPLKDCWRH